MPHPTKQQLCHELLPFFQSWKRAVKQVEEIKNEMLSVGTKSELEGMKKKMAEAEKEVNKAREEYEEVAYKEVEYEREPIVRKDAVLLANIEERKKVINNFQTKNKRVNYIQIFKGDLSFVEHLYFPDEVRCLNLKETALPKKITFPDSVRYLTLSYTDLPENFIIPDRIVTLNLSNTTSLENLTGIPDSVQVLIIVGTIIPDNLTIPVNVKDLYLRAATLPENLTIPDSVQELHLEDAVVKDTYGNKYPLAEHQDFMEKLNKLEQKNPDIRIWDGNA